MFLETIKTIRLYERKSKLGFYHTYKRSNTVYMFRCDCCSTTFLRPRAKVNPCRATNDYKHVCGGCNTKQYAQSVGVKMRSIYKMDASSVVEIGRKQI